MRDRAPGVKAPTDRHAAQRVRNREEQGALGHEPALGEGVAHGGQPAGGEQGAVAAADVVAAQAGHQRDVQGARQRQGAQAVGAEVRMDQHRVRGPHPLDEYAAQPEQPQALAFGGRRRQDHPIAQGGDRVPLVLQRHDEGLVADQRGRLGLHETLARVEGGRAEHSDDRPVVEMRKVPHCRLVNHGACRYKRQL